MEVVALRNFWGRVAKTHALPPCVWRLRKHLGAQQRQKRQKPQKRQRRQRRQRKQKQKQKQKQTP
jgi:hypothetical protein